MLKYHGTPITPMMKLYELRGRNFCVSFAAPEQVDICHQIGQSVMLDNGAFTFWRQRREPDWAGYYAWCREWLVYPTTWAVIPDVIDGTEEENDLLLVHWYKQRLPKGAPVWHMNESLERLRRLCHAYPRVCIGSSGAYADLDTPQWHDRMCRAMNRVCGTGPVPVWLHMLRGLDLAGSEYPFASADSTNIARNHAGNSSGRQPRSPRLMADEVDGRNCPPRWRIHDQLALKAESK